MSFQLATADLIKVLDPGAAATRASWSKMRRPWTPGYRAKARASAAAELKGFDSYPVSDEAHVIVIRGAGAAPNASPFTYELAGLTSIALPLSDATALIESENYLNAVATIYPSDSRGGGDSVLLERLGVGALDVTRAFWRVTDADTLVVAVGYAGGLYSDLPKGWVMEIQVPTASDISILWAPAAAGATAVDVADFMATGGTGAAGVVDLDRVYN